MIAGAERPTELSAELLRLLVDSVKDYAIFVLTPEGRVATWNAGAARIKGYAAEEIIGSHFSRFYRREEIEAGKCEMELTEAARIGRFEDEGWRLRKDGSRFWANVVITALRDATGRLVGYAKVTRDLTERRETEQAARRLAEAGAAQQAATSLQHVSTALAAAITREGVSEAVASQVLGAIGADAGSLSTCIPHERALQVDWTSARSGHGSEIGRVDLDDASALAAILQGRQPRFLESAPEIESALPRACRQGRPLEVAAILPLVVRGECIGVLVLGRTEPRPFSLAERALASTAANQCALALDRASIFARELEGKRRADFLSQASAQLASSLDIDTVAQRLATLAVPEIGDWCVIELVDEEGLRPVALAHTDPEKLDVVRELQGRYPPEAAPYGPVADVLETGRSRLYPTIRDEDLAQVCRDPGQLEAVRALGLRSGLIVPLLVGERAIGVMALARAETDHRYRGSDLDFVQSLAARAALAMDNARLYAELQHAVRARDDFMSVAGHELRTPLAAMQLTLQTLDRLLMKQETHDPVIRERVGKAMRNGERLARLIEELLDVSRLRTGRLQLELEELDLAKLVHTVVTGLSELVSRSGSDLRLEVESPLVGRWDQFRLEQVITNLVTNALKYGLGKPVVVQLRRDGDTAVLGVRDFGIGIDPAHHRRIFERFERAVSGRNYAGLGLGLWISRQIVEASGGRIDVESSPDEGSHFAMRLPLGPQGGQDG